MANNRLIYSSELGRLCPECSQAIKNCRCKKVKDAKPGDGIVRISRSTAGRKGKGVTLITGVPLAGEALKELARQLKQKCGSGGTLKDGVIEIQGEHRDQLVEELQKLGWTVKRAGG
ncbi:MAG: translation initiation factor Sui1 [Desulfuromonadales bacterium]|nr:translation initiation factor Sui1 [Desulfuromonadales bacterium]